MGINNTSKLKSIREALFQNGASPVDPPNKATSIMDALNGASRGNPMPAFGNQHVDMDDKASYGDSKYDDMTLTRSQLEQYGGSVNKMRATRQPWSHQVANGLAKVIPNVVMGTIGQTAAALDIEDYKNSDDEVGNWLTNIMNKGQEAMNANNPIYRSNPGKALDIGDSGWWYDNAFSLVESIASFAATGGIIAKGITTLSRASKAMNLAKSMMAANTAEVGGNAFNTVVNAVMLNQAEAILEATDVYNNIYELTFDKTQDEGASKQKAADAAAATVSINRLNIPLNLSSANLFFRAPKATRRLLESPYTKATLGRGVLEGGQESVEELVNTIASNYGTAVGTDQEYGLAEVIKDLTTPEAAEAALLGFLGGMGQTVLTTEAVNRFQKTIDPKTGKKTSVRDYNIKEYEDFRAEVKKLDEVASSLEVGSFTSAFKSAADMEKINQAIVAADQTGQHEKAADLRKLLVSNQAWTSFERGTTEHLVKLYEAIAAGPQKDGMEKDYKSKARQAIRYIETMEDVYNRVQVYANPEAVYYNRAMSYGANESYVQAKTAVNSALSKLSPIINRMADSEIFDPASLTPEFLAKKIYDTDKDLKVAQRIKNTPEYKEVLEAQDEVKTVSKRLDALDKEYTKITSGDYQEKAKREKDRALSNFKAMLENMSKQAEVTAEAEAKEKAKEEKITKQTEEEEVITEVKTAKEETKIADQKTLENSGVGDIITVSPVMSKKFAGKSATIVKRENGKITLQDNVSGHKFTITDATYTKKEVTPVTLEEDFSTEGGEDLIPLTQKEIDEKDSAKDTTLVQPEDGGAKIVSTIDKGGEYLPWIQEQYPLLPIYERTPISKKGKPVTFEVNDNLAVLNDNQKAALRLYQAKDFTSNRQLLIDHLPLNVVIRKETENKPKINGPLEALPYSNKNGAQDNFNAYTMYLRAHIIDALSKGIAPENIVGTIQDQYKGLLKIDSTPQGTPERENAIQDLDAFKGDTSKVEIFMVNKDRNLVDTAGKIVRVGIGAKGELYTKIPQANGEPFFLKLNVKKVQKEEAEILYELYRQRMMDADTGISTTLGDLSKELRDRISKVLGPTAEQSAMPKAERPYLTPLELIGKKKNDITIKDITDFLIYDGSKNSKSQVRLDGAVLRFGTKRAFKKVIELEGSKQEFIKFLTEQKRHHIKYRVKANDPVGTRVHAANRAYINYLLQTRILNTNAVVNQPTFQGRTQIYLNLDVKAGGEVIGTESDPNKPRPEKVQPVETVTKVEKVVPKDEMDTLEKGIRDEMDEATSMFREKISEMESKGTLTDAEKIGLQRLKNVVSTLNAEYEQRLKMAGFDINKPTESKGVEVVVKKDSKSDWNLIMDSSGKLINKNTGKEVTDQKLINKAHLKAGFLSYTQVDLGNNKVYAVTEDDRIINISKGKDGKISVSAGNEITKTSSTGKKVMEQLESSKPQAPIKPRGISEKTDEIARKSQEKVVPLHEVPGTPENEAKKKAVRQKPKGEQPTLPKVTEQEKELKEEPEKECGPTGTTPPKLTQAELRKQRQRRKKK